MEFFPGAGNTYAVRDARNDTHAYPRRQLVIHYVAARPSSLLAGDLHRLVIMKITSLLVATDFSAGAEVALASALPFAQRLGASIHLLHVVEGFSGGAWGSEIYVSNIAELQAAIVRDAEVRLGRAADAIEHKLKVTTEVQVGRAAATVVDVARRRKSGLIVSGTHGRTGLSHLLMGSVAETIVRTAPCPVLTARTPREGLRQIVVATDFSPTADAALSCAVGIASAFGASLHLLHVVEDPFRSTVGARYEQTLAEIHEWLMMDARARLSQSLAALRAITASSEAIAGTAAAGITGRAANLDADLIVMGTRGRSALAHVLLGSVADRVMRTASCPVVTVRTDAILDTEQSDQSMAARSQS